jgi:hypothetical protein
MPIDIPTRKRTARTSNTQYWEPFFYIATPPIHHRLDDITNYCRPGTSGWEFAQRRRARNAETKTGKVLGGSWPLRDYRGEEKVKPMNVEVEEKKEGKSKAETKRGVDEAWNSRKV